MLQDKKVILFDMDGTLIDSVGVWNEVDRRLIAKLGGAEMKNEDIQIQRDTALREYSKHANPYLQYCTFLKEKYNSALSPEQVVDLRYGMANEYLINDIDYKENAEVLLQKLKSMGLTLIITTATKRTSIDIYRKLNTNILQKAPLDEFFFKIYTREDVTEMKPNPEIYYTVMKELGVTPQDCLIFEDSLIGVDAANNAGIEVVVMYDKYSDHEREEINEKADYSFDNYAAVLEAIEAELC